MKYIPHDYQTRWHKENDKEVMPDEVHPTRISAEGDKLITLSTCEYSQNDGRLLVVAKKTEG